MSNTNLTILCRAVLTSGNLFCRTDNQVKNRWHATLEKEAQRAKQKPVNTEKLFLEKLLQKGMNGFPILELPRGNVVRLSHSTILTL